MNAGLFTTGIVEAEKIATEVQGLCLEAGFPVYPSIGRAAQAIVQLISYHENRGS